MSVIAHRRVCALCGSDTADDIALSLPPTPCANEFLKRPARQDVFPLDLQLCAAADCGHLQLEAVVDPTRLFDDYVYVSGTSPVFVAHFAEYARQAAETAGLGPDSLVVDIGSNDGTLLARFLENGMTRVHGVEPAGRIAAAAVARGIPTTNAYFDRPVAQALRAELGPAQLVTANNVFAHIADLEHTALSVGDLLAPHGVFIFEVSYLLDVVEQGLFDTIYHEHLSYHAVRPLIGFFARLGMTLFDVQRVRAHGGSIRVYVSAEPRPVSARVAELVELEISAGLFRPETYSVLRKQIAARASELRAHLAALRSEGARFCGYGAPAKLTTMMYALELDRDDVEFVVDDSPLKRGLYTPGTHIPVVGSDHLAAVSGKGFWCVVFAWNFYDSIVARHSDWAGNWINPQVRALTG
ncbi:methyltransferase family protein [Nonomuraea fuscirosea]|uniref:Methyltransferase family protein n=1 Tax=Nonomuraea fuscirosea TaxID=1291556 RepID=A0A2T0NC32_9ACTN|nr:class I SAM-dependent methyltransferase [Nonomuraea fuscirosea]PRX70564.1 methyltransferase family protein [Nonomuraea fuscirosea]